MRTFDSNKAEYTRVRSETRAFYDGELNGSEVIVGEHPELGHVRLLKLAGDRPFHDYYRIECERLTDLGPSKPAREPAGDAEFTEVARQAEAQFDKMKLAEEDEAMSRAVSLKAATHRDLNGTIKETLKAFKA